MASFNMVQAINQTLMQEMERDSSIVVLGEDVGENGGVFRVTEGLYEKFGRKRVIDTPLSEACIVGTAVGMALNGLKPIPEIQFMGFSLLAFDQVVAHAARLRNRSRGRFKIPMVLRMPYGAGVKALEHHSESTEALYVHIPGLTVVVPSSPSEAKGLLTSSIRHPDPVIFLEPKRSYRLLRENVEEEEYTIPLGEAKIVQEGDDVTLIGWGAMMPIIREGVKDSDYDVEVIDLRTVSPMDTETVTESVKKTGRAIVVHEAPRTCGVGAEIVARINEKALLYLEAPVERVTGPDITIPLPQGENFYYISPEKIRRGIKRVMEF